MNPSDLLLTRAVSDGDTTTVRDLLRAGSNVNTTIGGQTPLILAIAFRHIEIVKILLEAGADPELKDSLGSNAIDWAERTGFAEGVGLLAKNQLEKPAIPPDTSSRDVAIYEKLAPPQNEKQSLPVSGKLQQRARSYEKSQQWVKGLKQRLDEKKSLKVKEPQLPAVSRAELENKPRKQAPHVGVKDDPPPAPSVLPKSEVINHPSDYATNVPDNPRSKDQTFSEEATTPIIAGDFSAPQPASSRSTLSSRKRCPKCNRLYDSVLLAYCAIDMTPLVEADSFRDTAAPETSRISVVWFLVVLTFIAAAGVTYVMIPSWISKQDAARENSPTKAASIENSPLVTGGLSGKQVNVPAPDYPVSARNAHVSGTVTVQVTVNKNGSVTSVKVIEGDRRLRNAAISAAQKATFSPEKLAGRGGAGIIAYSFRE
jgi:TonB family protein